MTVHLEITFLVYVCLPIRFFSGQTVAGGRFYPRRLSAPRSLHRHSYTALSFAIPNHFRELIYVRFRHGRGSHTAPVHRGAPVSNHVVYCRH